jgi:hypothetical protein
MLVAGLIDLGSELLEQLPANGRSYVGLSVEASPLRGGVSSPSRRRSRGASRLKWAIIYV